MSSLRPSILRVAARARVLPPSSSSSRLLHQAAARRLPYKDDMDRESLKPKAHENTQSGTDDETAARHGDAAFNPDKTAPEHEKDTAGKGSKRNPLAASPADHGFAKGGQDGGEAQPKRGEAKKSGGGDPPKAG
ncbi:hypothetical protein F5Y14DRAFT_258279 [Nemania sp. NC0429]|nr:hypothetical protein F5Y14DRAFT_258279 [Nemania sp. NC0429]